MTTNHAVDELEALERELFDAFELPGDPDAVDRLYAEDFFAINADGSTSDKTDVIEVVEDGRFPVVDEIENDETRVRVYGDVGVVTGRSRWPVDGFTAVVRHTQIWVDTDDGWRMVGWQGTPLDEASGLGPDES